MFYGNEQRQQRLDCIREIVTGGLGERSQMTRNRGRLKARFARPRVLYERLAERLPALIVLDDTCQCPCRVRSTVVVGLLERGPGLVIANVASAIQVPETIDHDQVR